MRASKQILYLASQSPRRRQMLTRMGIPFRVVPSAYCEKFLPGHSAADLALRHAVAKARKARLPARARFVMGADTVVSCAGKILGKPADEKQARRMIALLSGRINEVITAVALWDRSKKILVAQTSCSRVRIRTLSTAAQHEYVRQSHPYDKAGGYAIQGGPRIARRLSGSYSNIVGFPRELVRQLLKQAGF